MGFEVIGDQLRPCLDDDQLHVLADLFETMPSYDAGVDVLRFEVKHRQCESAIQKMYARRLIVRPSGAEPNNIYRPSLLALSVIETEAARSLEVCCEDIIQYLHSAYIADPYVVVSIADIKNVVTCDERELFEALCYLRDMPLGLISISNDASLSDTVNVQIAKTITQYSTLLDVYQQLLEWATVAEAEPTSTPIAKDAPIAPLAAHLDAILDNNNCSKINEEIVRVVRELRIALFKELRTLSAVGIRTVIDMVVNDYAKRDLGNFRNKVQWLNQKGTISDQAGKHLLEVLDLGSSAAHRGYKPSTKHLDTALIMLNSLVSDVYTMPDRIDEMKRDKPKRGRSPRTKKGS